MEDKMAPSQQEKYWATLIGLAVLAAGVGLFYLVKSGRIAAGQPRCFVCERPLHKAQVYIVRARDGAAQAACCPRCGLRFTIESEAQSAQATDFKHGGFIPAESAYYLEGSDIMDCCADTTVRSDSGMICEMHFDRCLPSLAAFSKVEDAEEYQRRHGGHIIDFAAARRSVAQQMGR